MSLTTESEARFNTFYHALLDEFVLPRDPHMLLRFKELYLENFEGVAPGPETEHPPFVPFTESEPVTADPISVGEPTSAQSFPEPSAPGTESVAE